MRSVSGPLIHLAMLSRHEFEKIPAKEHEAYEVKHRGFAGWSVMRKSDNVVMADGLAQKSDAQAWIEKNGAAPLKQAA